MNDANPHFHLEALRDRWLAGEASEADLARLREHEADCRTCRVEAWLCAEPDDAAAVASLVEDTGRWSQVFEAVDAARRPSAKVKPSRSDGASAGPAARRASRRVIAMGGAVLALAGGVAAAAGFSSARPEPAAILVVPPAKTAWVPSPPTTAGGVVLPRPPGSASARPAPSSSGSFPARAPSAAALFRAAQQARNRGDLGRARNLYETLLQRHPRSREAEVARVSLAAVLRDLGASDADALSQYDRYLDDRPAGTLAEEALVGRARSLERLGRRAEAKRTWGELLRRYPRSLHAAEARAKLQKR
ncbi:MAG: tetratricopeptide repeat protein [Myxococcota bacterium]